MVFGWGKKKPEKKQESEIIAPKEISLSEVSDVVLDLTKIRTKQLIAEVSRFRDKANPLIKELSGIIRKLEKDDLKVDDIDKHLRIIVARGKKQVIEIIKKDTSELRKVSSFDDVINLSNNLGSMLKKIGDVLGRQTRIIHIFAKKYADQLKQILEELNQINTEIKSLIKNYETSKSHSQSIKDSLQRVTELEKVFSSKKERINELQNSLQNLKQKIETKRKTLTELKNSNEYQAYQSLKQNLSSIDIDKNKIKNEINMYFSKISRPLNRYEYVSSLEKDQKLLLSQLIQDPFNVLFPKNKDSIIIILENIRKGISSGSISVKDEEKSMAQLTETVEALDTLISKVTSFHNQKKELETKISSTKPSNLETLEESLLNFQRESDDTDSKIHQLSQEVKEDEKDIPQLIKKIESELRLFSNTQYTVTKAKIN